MGFFVLVNLVLRYRLVVMYLFSRAAVIFEAVILFLRQPLARLLFNLLQKILLKSSFQFLSVIQSHDRKSRSAIYVSFDESDSETRLCAGKVDSPKLRKKLARFEKQECFRLF